MGDNLRRATRALSALCAACGLGLIGLGVWILVEDLVTEFDEFDGLGIILGPMVVGAGLVPTVPAIAATVLLAAPRRLGYVLALVPAVLSLFVLVPWLREGVPYGWLLLPDLALLGLSAYGVIRPGAPAVPA